MYNLSCNTSSFKVLASLFSGNDISEYLLDDTVSNIINDNGFDDLYSKIAVTESGRNILYIKKNSFGFLLF